MLVLELASAFSLFSPSGGESSAVAILRPAASFGTSCECRTAERRRLGGGRRGVESLRVQCEIRMRGGLANCQLGMNLGEAEHLDAALPRSRLNTVESILSVGSGRSRVARAVLENGDGRARHRLSVGRDPARDGHGRESGRVDRQGSKNSCKQTVRPAPPASSPLQLRAGGRTLRYNPGSAESGGG